MQAEIERSDGRFRRVWFCINLGWGAISLFVLILGAVGTFEKHPQYLHDWHSLVIYALILLIIALFGSVLLPGWRSKEGERAWPPPLAHSLLYWVGMYVPVTLLAVIDNSFVWGYFIVLGCTFGLFTPRFVVTLAILIFLSFSWLLRYLTWPIAGSLGGSLLGNSITFISLVLVCIALQHLIGERFERGQLLQQLAQSNNELEEAQRRLAESAAQEQELAVLRERTRLAREMHDTLGHALVLISVKLEAAQRLRERDPQRCDQELEATKEIVRNSMRDLRASIANLRSPALEREPACRALSRYAREMAQRVGLRVSYDLHPDIEGLPEPIEEALWKVGQEALANIEKHAQAHNVLLHMSRRDDHVFMKIADDGIGLPADLCQRQKEHEISYESPAGHYGLSGMRERVKNVHGRISIHSADEHGTVIEVTLPLVEAPLIPT
jgi:signal transduction histidine kinase